MSKFNLKISFNGEQKGLYNKVNNYENFIENEVDNSFTSKYYYSSSGSLQAGHLNDVPQLRFNNIIDLEKITFSCKIDYSIYNANVEPKEKYVRYYFNKDSNYILLNKENVYDYWSQVKNNDYITYEFRLNDALKYAIQYYGALTPTNESYVIIRFPNVIASNETNSFNQGYIKIGFIDDTSYIDYNNDSFSSVNFIRRIESESEPSFELNKLDGEVNLIDKNLYIQERLKTKQIKNYFITKVIYDGNQLGKFVGVNGKYPHSSKTINYILNDYLSLLEKTECDDYHYHSIEPNKGFINGYQLYKDLQLLTSKVVDIKFSPLKETLINYLSDFTFIDPYIKCYNLKDLWQAFLKTTLTNMYINEYGNIALDCLISTNQTEPIIISQTELEQDIDFNLLPNNVISNVTCYSKTYSEQVINKLNYIYSITSGQISGDDYNISNQFYLIDEIQNYINSGVNGEYKVLEVREPSLFYKFLDYKKITKVRTITAYGETLERNVYETSILAESFIDLGEEGYQSFYCSFKPQLHIGFGGGEEEKNVNYLLNNNYKYNVVWLSEEEYNNLTIYDLEFDTIYFNSKSKLTSTGRLFKSLIPITHFVETGLSGSLLTTNYFFNSLTINFYSNEKQIIKTTKSSNEYYKNSFDIDLSNLVYTEKGDKKVDVVVNSYKELSELDRSQLSIGSTALVKSDETYNYYQTIYTLVVGSELNFWFFDRVDKTSRYKNNPISIFIAETLQKLYNNGRKTIKFTTSVYDFFNSEGILQYKAQNGEILKVGDLIKLPSVSEETFKIISILGSNDGFLNLNVVAIEFSKVEE